MYWSSGCFKPKKRLETKELDHDWLPGLVLYLVSLFHSLSQYSALGESRRPVSFRFFFLSFSLYTTLWFEVAGCNVVKKANSELRGSSVRVKL